MNGERPVVSKPADGGGGATSVGAQDGRARHARPPPHAEAPRADEPAKSAGHDEPRQPMVKRGEGGTVSGSSSPGVSSGSFFASRRPRKRLRRLEEPGQRVRTCERRPPIEGTTERTTAGRTFEMPTMAPTAARTQSPVQPDPRPADRRDAQDGREDRGSPTIVPTINARSSPAPERARIRERLQPFGRGVDHGAADGDERRRLVVDEGSDDLGDPKGEERGQDADDRPARPRRLRSLRRRRCGFAEGSHDVDSSRWLGWTSPRAAEASRNGTASFL